MKNLFLLVSLLLIAFCLKSQELAPASINKSKILYTHNLEVSDGWADYIYDAELAEHMVAEEAGFNFWGGYTEIPRFAVSNFVKFRAAAYNFATNDAVNSKLTVKIFKDGELDYAVVSNPKTISEMTKDTLRVVADYAPLQAGNYQVSMTVSQDADDELPNNNGWGYSFKVNNNGRFSRVRHGMENYYNWAGPSKLMAGGNDGDRCIQRFAIPENADIHVNGISIFIDNYTNRPNEIAAINNGDFSMIAHLYKVNENDSIIDTGISSNEYVLAIGDTATWVTLDFNDEDNLIVDAGLYYAGIEIFTGNINLRFQIGEDSDATKQPNGGGLVYINNTNPFWYNIGDNYAIDLNIATYSAVYVTFNVDMTSVNAFNPATDTLYVTGNFANENSPETGWDIPGTGKSLKLTDVDGDGIYSGFTNLTMGFGEMQYKYYVNSGWLGGEWEGEPNRTLNIADNDVVINPPDIFSQYQSINDKNYLTEVVIYPNPFINNLAVGNLGGAVKITVSNILGQTLMAIPVAGNKININTQSLEKGIYLITITDKNNNTITKRVIKN